MPALGSRSHYVSKERAQKLYRNRNCILITHSRDVSGAGARLPLTLCVEERAQKL